MTAGPVLLLRIQVLDRASQDAGCSPPRSLDPNPSRLYTSYQVLLGRRGAPTLLAAPSSCSHWDAYLPGPVWASSWGQVRAHCPCWARPGPEVLAVLLLLIRGGGHGGGLVPGLGARCSRVPSTAGSGRQQRQNSKSQLPAPHRCLLPSFLPTRLLLQPPTSFCSSLWQPGNAAPPASLLYARGRPPSMLGGHHLGQSMHTSPSRRRS